MILIIRKGNEQDKIILRTLLQKFALKNDQISLELSCNIQLRVIFSKRTVCINK